MNINEQKKSGVPQTDTPQNTNDSCTCTEHNVSENLAQVKKIKKKPIFSKQSHYFDPIVAKNIDNVHAAIVLNHISYWIDFNENLNQNFIHGRTWMYSRLSDMAKQFPYLNERQVKYAIDLLVSNNYLIKGNFNNDVLDKTCWYAFSNDLLALFEIISTKEQNCPSTDEIVTSTDKIVRRLYKEEDRKRIHIGKEERECSAHAPNTPTHTPIAKKEKIAKKLYGQFVALVPGQYETLCSELGQAEVDDLIKRMNLWVPNNKHFKDYAAAIRSWHLNKKPLNVPPGAQKPVELPQGLNEKISENKAISERIRGIVDSLCDGNRSFRVYDECSVLRCNDYEGKRIDQTYLYDNLDPHKFVAKMNKEVSAIFPEAKEKIKTVEEKMNEVTRLLAEGMRMKN